jgi:hypothetical protein
MVDGTAGAIGMLVRYTTDGVNHGDGFSATFECIMPPPPPPPNPCVGPGVAYVDQGELLASGGYTVSMSCTWTLSCSDPGLSPQLVFIKFATERSSDFVTIDNPSIQLHGRHLPPLQTAVGNTMTVTFTSDTSAGWSERTDGFDALFSCGRAFGHTTTVFACVLLTVTDLTFVPQHPASPIPPPAVMILLASPSMTSTS